MITSILATGGLIALAVMVVPTLLWGIEHLTISRLWGEPPRGRHVKRHDPPPRD